VTSALIVLGAWLAVAIGVGATWAVKDRRWWKMINDCDAHRDDTPE
jgi:hypothetical protein